MAQKFGNNAFSTLGGAISDSDVTANCAAGQGGRFPTVVAPDFCMLTFEDALGNIEVVKCTAHAAGSTSFTIVRAQQGTAARGWALGDTMEHRATALEMTAWEGDIDNLEATRSRWQGQAYSGTHDYSTADLVKLPANTQIGPVAANEIAQLDGILTTMTIQAQLDAAAAYFQNLIDTLNVVKANLASGTYGAGVHDFTAGTLKAPTLPGTVADDRVATMQALANAIFASYANLPADPGDAVLRYLTTISGNKAWTQVPQPDLAMYAAGIV